MACKGNVPKIKAWVTSYLGISIEDGPRPKTSISFIEDALCLEYFVSFVEH